MQSATPGSVVTIASATGRLRPPGADPPSSPPGRSAGNVVSSITTTSAESACWRVAIRHTPSSARTSLKLAATALGSSWSVRPRLRGPYDPRLIPPRRSVNAIPTPWFADGSNAATNTSAHEVGDVQLVGPATHRLGRDRLLRRRRGRGRRTRRRGPRRHLASRPVSYTHLRAHETRH